MKEKNASHYQRLSGYGLEKDIKYCPYSRYRNVLVVYEDGKLITPKMKKTTRMEY